MRFLDKHLKRYRIKKFDDNIEKEFIADYNSKSIVYIRLSLIVILSAGIIPYSFLDILIVPETVKFAWFIRYAIWAPILSLALFLTYKPIIKVYFQAIASITNLVLCFGVLAMIALTKRSELGYSFYYAGIMVTLSTIIPLRIRFKLSLFILGTVFVLYLLIAIFIQKMLVGGHEMDYAAVFINNLFFLLSVSLSVGIASFILESYARSNFFHQLILQKEKVRIQEMNRKINLQNEKIKIQSEQIKEVFETKTRLFSIIAHDLKNPFNSLIGFSGLLLESSEKKDFDNIYKYSHIIHETSEKTFRLLNNLLDWSLLESNKITLSLKEVNFKNLIQENIEFMADFAKQKNIHLISDVQSDIFLIVDGNMLHTVLRNLISNAVKFTPENGVVEVKTIDKTDTVEVLVTDSGVGIDNDTLEKIFNTNTGFSTKGTNNETGTGLGLLLCQNFIKLHHGEIWVKSELQKGTTFGFSIPKNVPKIV